MSIREGIITKGERKERRGERWIGEWYGKRLVIREVTRVGLRGRLLLGVIFEFKIEIID